MPTVRAHGRNVHYLDQGAGVPVVLVHSGGLSSRQWSRMAGRLGARRIIAPDLLGSGASDPVPGDEPFHFDRDVEALDAVLDTLETPYHLVGHSYGGLIALMAAKARPERVRSLSLFEPVAFGVMYSAGAEDGIRNLEDYDSDGTFFDDAAGGGEAWLERFIDWWQGEGAWKGLSDSARASFLRVGRKVFQEVRSLTADRTPHSAYAGVKAPALLMSGARSPLAARRVCEVLARSLPNARLVMLEDAGHMAPLTHGQAVATLILEHIEAAERSSPDYSQGAR